MLAALGSQESAWSEAFEAIVVSDAASAAAAATSSPNAAAKRPAPLYTGADSMTVRELKQLANKLTQWQHALKKSMGPLFSDPLRALKRIITHSEQAEKAGQAAAVDEMGEEKEARDSQRADKRKRVAEDTTRQIQISASSKRARGKQPAPASKQAEQSSDAG